MQDSKRRKQYLVNRRLQINVMLQLVAVMVGIAILYTIGLAILPGADVEELNAAEMRAFMTKTTAIYFVLATAILATLTIIVLQRVAGPVLVIHRAVKAMRRGDYGARLQLRRRDHLKDLAEEVAGLRDEMMARVRDLHSCLDEGDIEGARELFVQLGVREDAPAAREEVGADS